MTTVFTAREIAETAVEKEMKRRDFYANVAKLSTKPEMIKLFEFLTAEEDRHVATFKDLRDGVSVEEVRPEEYDADMEAYMDSVVEDRLYSKIGLEDFVQKAIDAKDVFRLAIALEKGWSTGPRLYYCGFAISENGGHGVLRNPQSHRQSEDAMLAFGCGHFPVHGLVVCGVDGVRPGGR